MHWTNRRCSPLKTLGHPLKSLPIPTEILFIGNSNIAVSQVVSIGFVLAGVALLTAILILNRRKNIAIEKVDIVEENSTQNENNEHNNEEKSELEKDKNIQSTNIGENEIEKSNDI